MLAASITRVGNNANMSRICHSAFRVNIAFVNFFYSFKTVSYSVKLSPAFKISHKALCSSSKSLGNWGSKKKSKRNLQIKLPFINMGDPKSEEILAPLRASVKEQVGND